MYATNESTLCISSEVNCEKAIMPGMDKYQRAVSQNSAKLGNYKMPIKLRET